MFARVLAVVGVALIVSGPVAAQQSQERPPVIDVHLQGAFSFLRHTKGDFPVCEDTAERILALPFWTDMPREIVARVSRAVKNALAAH